MEVSEWHPSSRKSSFLNSNFLILPLVKNSSLPTNLILGKDFKIVLSLTFRSLATFIAIAIFSQRPSE